MSKSNWITRPSPEVQAKIRTARKAIASQKHRVIQCQYCKHPALVVFEDTRGHVQVKCKACGKENLLNVLSMRRLRRYYRFY